MAWTLKIVETGEDNNPDRTLLERPFLPSEPIPKQAEEVWLPKGQYPDCAYYVVSTIYNYSDNTVIVIVGPTDECDGYIENRKDIWFISDLKEQMSLESWQQFLEEAEKKIGINLESWREQLEAMPAQKNQF